MPTINNSSAVVATTRVPQETNHGVVLSSPVSFFFFFAKIFVYDLARTMFQGVSAMAFEKNYIFFILIIFCKLFVSNYVKCVGGGVCGMSLNSKVATV